MKRKTAIFLALGMAAGLTVLGGCGTGNKSDIVQEEAKETEEAEEAEETAPAAGGEYRSVTVNSSETVSVVPDMAEQRPYRQKHGGGMPAAEFGICGAGD